MANRTEQRLTTDDGPSGVDLSDRIADHQARLAGINTEQAVEASVEKVVPDSLGNESLENEPEEALSLLQQQEQLMQRLMQEESQRQAQGVVESPSFDEAEESVPVVAKDFEEVDSEIDSEPSDEMDQEALAEQAAEAELLAEAEAEKELLEQEAAAERELLAMEALEREALEVEALETEEQENKLGLENSTDVKKNSLFDD
jgi:hypothetical protein